MARTADQQLPRPFVHCAHCFNGIDDQVGEHLLQLDAIRLHHRQLLPRLDLQRDVMPEQLAPGQGGGVEDRLVDVQRLVPWWHLFDEAANPADDVTRSLAVLDDTAEGLPDLAEVRRLGTKPTQGGIGSGDDRGDRLSDFVGNRGREVPHGGDAVGVRKRHRALFLGFEQPHVFDRDHRLVTISSVICKLLANTAEDRYQTAAGVESDLRCCLDRWERQRRIEEFPLGENDTSDRLLIPEKLYGRAREIDTLLAAFDRVAAGGAPELVGLFPDMPESENRPLSMSSTRCRNRWR